MLPAGKQEHEQEHEHEQKQKGQAGWNGAAHLSHVHQDSRISICRPRISASFFGAFSGSRLRSSGSTHSAHRTSQCSHTARTSPPRTEQNIIATHTAPPQIQLIVKVLLLDEYFFGIDLLYCTSTSLIATGRDGRLATHIYCTVIRIQILKRV